MGNERPKLLSIEIDALADGQPAQLHGFASDANDDWVATGWFQALVAAGYDVIAPDLRGHGLSSKSRNPRDYRLEAFAGDCIAAARFCWGHSSFSVVGYSMGAHIAMTLSLANPDQIETLVLGGMGERIAATVGLAPEFADALDAVAEHKLDTSALPSYALRFAQHAALKSYNDLAVLAACLRGQSCVFDLAKLAQVAAPTLVMVGENDKLAGAPYRVAGLFPVGIAATVPDVNHASALTSEPFRSRAMMHFGIAEPLGCNGGLS
ncbi:alpha/beta fold hydrolase [Bradyrhizobium sp. Pear77]|uniref:alpha/beta fold hydrolase n=1 Tax=Bradyrhizobium TaxID=374 RepID=UPI001E5CAEE7|nr:MULTISPECIES: alpha/beta fold hydrolase [Bradyrhizobium]MCC8954369.1 alpha/beta fold hydrolase [Bradyrhizobium altum]MCC8964371.1 alpha/beta fold hydrolase [Bradyrhizobium oropedii]